MQPDDPTGKPDTSTSLRRRRSDAEKRLRSFKRATRRRLREARSAPNPPRQPIFIPKLPVETFIGGGFASKGRLVLSRKFGQKVHTVRIPTCFSFSRNPVETINVMHTLAYLTANPVDQIYIDHGGCTYMGLAASAVYDVLFARLMRTRKKDGISGGIGGRVPQSPDALRFFQVMGAGKQFNIEGLQAPPEVESAYTQFPLFHGRKSNDTGSSNQEEAITKLTDYVDRCLQRGANYSLNESGRKKILAWSGEIIANAEEHSGTNDWWAIGYMVMSSSTRDETATVGECHLAIFNFGRSLAESLKSKNTPEETRRELAELSSLHRDLRFFGLGARYTQDDLFTMYALQEGVSSKNASPGKGDRGNGTVKLITAFQKLGDCTDADRSPEMALISGSSMIRFTQKYPMSQVGDRMVIAFNDENDLRKRPCSDHVKTIKSCYFPGTILSFNFYVDRRYIEAGMSSQL